MNNIVQKCFDCDNEAMFVYTTQFAGDHFYCKEHSLFNKSQYDDGPIFYTKYTLRKTLAEKQRVKKDKELAKEILKDMNSMGEFQQLKRIADALERIAKQMETNARNQPFVNGPMYDPNRVYGPTNWPPVSPPVTMCGAAVDDQKA